MRFVRLLVALLCLVAGILVGALNPQVVSIDLGFVVLSATLGVSLLVALLLGVLLGGAILAVSVVLPLRQRLRRERGFRDGGAPVRQEGTASRSEVDWGDGVR